MIFLALDIARLIANIAWISLFVIVFLILYRLLLKRLKKGRQDQSNYIKLMTPEQHPASGKVRFFIDLQKETNVKFSFQAVGQEEEKIVLHETIQAGGKVIPFDTTDVANGTYYFTLTTDNQKITKKIVVSN